MRACSARVEVAGGAVAPVSSAVNLQELEMEFLRALAGEKNVMDLRFSSSTGNSGKAYIFEWCADVQSEARVDGNYFVLQGEPEEKNKIPEEELVERVLLYFAARLERLRNG